MTAKGISKANVVGVVQLIDTDPDLRLDTIQHKINELTIQGLLSQQNSTGSVANFRGIKYASIPGRWHESTLVDLASQKGFLDATQWGPRPPQTVDMMHHLTGHLYPRMSTYDATSEFNCLNLNIYSPITAISSTQDHLLPAKHLPVIVWIHGGSFEWGDGSCECDGQYLVKYSTQISKPVVVVAINYRLGTLGFFTSKELRQEARDRGEAGHSNLGFYDQRLALQWVQKNIHHFGGDASRVTLAGESAGAISVLAHLRGTQPLAKCALMMSPGTIYPRTFSETQVAFDKICAKLNLAGQTDKEKIAALRQLSCDQLHEAGANRLDTILCEDPHFFQVVPAERFEEVLKFPSWMSRIVVGQTREELGIMGHYLAFLTPEQLLASWKQVYKDPEYAAEVLGVYQVTDMAGPERQLPARNSHQGRQLVQILIEHASDSLFGKAVRSIAETHLSTQTDALESHSPQVYLYRFDQEDTLTVDDSQKGKSYHSIDNAFLFHFPQIAGVHASENFRNTANSFGSAALRLAYDEEPWQPLAPAGIETENIFATFSGRGLQAEPLSAPKWSSLVNSSERINKFLLGKNVVMELVPIAVQAATTASSTI